MHHEEFSNVIVLRLCFFLTFHVVQLIVRIGSIFQNLMIYPFGDNIMINEIIAILHCLGIGLFLWKVGYEQRHLGSGKDKFLVIFCLLAGELIYGKIEFERPRDSFGVGIYWFQHIGIAMFTIQIREFIWDMISFQPTISSMGPLPTQKRVTLKKPVADSKTR